MRNTNKSAFLLLLVNSVLSQLQDLRFIGSYQPCWKDDDCKPNASCLGKSGGRPAVCACEEGYEMYRNDTFYDCFKAMGPGEPCTFDYHCKIKLAELGVCDEKTKTCTCEQGAAHVGPDGLCYKTRKLDEHCLVDYNCLLANGKYAFCAYSHICSCPLGQGPSKDKRSCVPHKHIGEKCSTDAECDFTGNASCREICTCNIGHSIARDGKRCLRAALEFGQQCEEDDQCSRYLERSICVNQTCSCIPGYHGYLTNCIKSVEIGGPCNKNHDCVVKDKPTRDVVCKEGICTKNSDQSGTDKGLRIKSSYMCLLLFVIIFYIK